MERQRRILLNVAMIEAREREQAAQITAQAAAAQLLAPFPTSDHKNVDSVAQEPEAASAPDRPPRTRTEPLQPLVQTGVEDPPSPWKPPPRDEPHSWSPRASVRRGG